MFARRVRSSKRNAYGVTRIKRDTYNTHNGFSLKSGNGWWELRAKVEKRSNGKCEALVSGNRCGKRGNEVHHIVPLSKGGTNTLANLIMLCKDCHDRRHRHLFKLRK